MDVRERASQRERERDRERERERGGGGAHSLNSGVVGEKPQGGKSDFRWAGGRGEGGGGGGGGGGRQRERERERGGGGNSPKLLVVAAETSEGKQHFQLDMHKRTSME